MRPPDVSVIVCTYSEERWDDLGAAVDSLRRQRIRPCEIVVVVDNNPPLAARVQDELRDVVVVENRNARGLSSARNAGVASARGEIVAFLDDDARAEPDWLETLLACYADGRVLGAGGAVEPVWERGRPAWFPDEFDWVVGCSYRGMPVRTAAIRNLIGANMSFRREVFASVGGFSSAVGRIGQRPVGCEETELCIRALQRWPGHVLVYEPRARVEHQVPAVRSRLRYFVSRCFAEGLSKAAVVRLRGSQAGLESERRYALRVLPAGFATATRQAVVSRSAASLERGGAIALGLATTTAGYLVGRARCPRTP
jgi:glycosyltransferase involved in cell wall biosynthesis